MWEQQRIHVFLHYTTNRKTMKGNHLLLSDVGAEYHGYTADVTRTMPVDGKFSKEEKIIYDIVLEAQDKAIEACVPGKSILHYQYHCHHGYFSAITRVGLDKISFRD